MALGNVVLLPGFTGSGLLRERNFPIPAFSYWPQYPPLLGFGFPFLELAADGVTPALQNAGNIKVAGVVRLVYDPLIAVLKRDWNVYAVGYDWRLSLTRSAQTVRTEINLALGNQDFNIVGHSMGGLLARMVWREFGLNGEQNRIKRIVTLGAPHWGTYSAVEAFTRKAETYRLLVIGTVPAYLDILDSGPARSFQFLFSDLDKVLTSWPGLYEQFPQLASPIVAADPARLNLFTSQFWDPINTFVSPTRLNEARATHAILLSPAAMPPDTILVSVAGRGINTPSAITVPFERRVPLPYFRSDGDGNVAREEARLRSAAWETFAEHFNMIYHPLVLANLTNLIQNGLTATPPIVENPFPFAVPGPAGPGGPETTQAPQIFSTIDFGDGPRRPPATSEPRPAYCP